MKPSVQKWCEGRRKNKTISGSVTCDLYALECTEIRIKQQQNKNDNF